MSGRWDVLERPDAYLQRAVMNASWNWNRRGRTVTRKLPLLGRAPRRRVPLRRARRRDRAASVPAACRDRAALLRRSHRSRHRSRARVPPRHRQITCIPRPGGAVERDQAVNTLEDDIRAVLHSQADAMQVPEPHLGRSLTLTRVTPNSVRGVVGCSPPRRCWSLVVAAVVFVQRGSHEPAVVTTTNPPRHHPSRQPRRRRDDDLERLGGVRGRDGLDDVRHLPRSGRITGARIAGSDDDAIDQVCPAFSPDGTRLAYGQAK